MDLIESTRLVGRLVDSKLTIINGIFNEFEANVLWDITLDDLRKNMLKVENEYLMIMNKPFMQDNLTGNETLEECISCNIFLNLDNICAILKMIIESMTLHTTFVCKNPRTLRPLQTQMLSYIARYPSNNDITEISSIDYNVCEECHTTMQVDSAKSRFYCECGYTKTLCGVLFDEPQFFGSTLSKMKHASKFDRSEHFQHWWLNITGLEPDKQIGDKEQIAKIVADIKELAIIRCKILRTMNVNTLRQLLSELKLEDLYNHTTKLLVLITGINPPYIPDEYTVQVQYYYRRVLEVKKIIKTKKKNMRYYPYYIMKILDIVLPRNNSELRKILFYIYMQSKKTIEECDVEWKEICGMINIPYYPTILSFNLAYKPWE